MGVAKSLPEVCYILYKPWSNNVSTVVSVTDKFSSIQKLAPRVAHS